MNLLVILCVAAAVLSQEGSAFTLIGNNGNRFDIEMSHTSVCETGRCVVHNGILCACVDSGIPLCMRRNSQLQKFFCTCEPNEVMLSDVPCVCPVSGLISFDDCPASIWSLPVPPLMSPSNVRSVKGTNVRKPMTSLID